MAIELVPGGKTPAGGSVLCSSPLVDALSRYMPLDAAEERAVLDVPCTLKTFAADDVIVREGDRHAFTSLILTGAAMRYRYLVTGKRQIFGYLLPGDLCNAQFFMADRSDHDIAMISTALVALVPTHDLTVLAAAYPNVRRALVRTISADGAALRDCVCNIGTRNAPRRIAHFLCDLWDRLHAIDNGHQLICACIPLTQMDIADTIGLTVAHTSRCMQQLRKSGLVAWSRRALVVTDLPGLRAFANVETNRSSRGECKLTA